MIFITTNAAFISINFNITIIFMTVYIDDQYAPYDIAKFIRQRICRKGYRAFREKKNKYNFFIDNNIVQIFHNFL